MRLGANEVAVLKNPGAMKGHRNSFDFILIVVRKTGDGGERMPKSDAG